MDFSNKVCHLCFHVGVPAPIILVIPLSNQFSVNCISVVSPSKCIKSLHSILIILAFLINFLPPSREVLHSVSLGEKKNKILGLLLFVGLYFWSKDLGSPTHI